MASRTKNITLSALFIALGILIPILFHGIGLGAMFLPMFWPVAASAFFLPLPYAVTAGILTPLISTLMTGMPPPPILYKMIFELAVLSFIISLLHSKTRLGIFWLIGAGLFCALAAGFLGAFAVAPIFGFPPELYAVASLIRSLPGVITMFVALPLFLKRITKEPIFNKTTMD